MDPLDQLLAEVTEFAKSDRDQAAVVNLYAHFTVDPAKADLQRADAASLEAHAEGWDQFADAIRARQAQPES